MPFTGTITLRRPGKWVTYAARVVGKPVPAAYFGRGRIGLFQDDGDFHTWVRNNLQGWVYSEVWSNGYREIYFNMEKFAILTYCEGDVDITVDDNAATFARRWESAEEYYAGSN